MTHSRFLFYQLLSVQYVMLLKTAPDITNKQTTKTSGLFGYSCLENVVQAMYASKYKMGMIYYLSGIFYVNDMTTHLC